MERLFIAILCAAAFAACNTDKEIAEPGGGESDRCIVFEYTPAPGQFVNEGFSAATPEEACAYAEKRLNAERASFVSLGGFGGRIVVGFGRSIPCGGPDVYDLQISGNAFDGSSEPGTVWVMRDENGNGMPDDVWYELKGSEYGGAGTVRGYAVTYMRPEGPGMPVKWVDDRGGSGEIAQVSYHSQKSYYPEWIAGESYTLAGTRLPLNAHPDPDRTTEEGEFWVWSSFDWGYVDNVGRNGDKFRIADAVTAEGAPAGLGSIDFIMVQTAVQGQCGNLGELSTEVTRFRNLHRRAR